MGADMSSHAAVFEKVLAAYETGGITYTDVLAQLRRLLATDAPPTELLEILRRRELIEPLPESAHNQVFNLLNDALERVDLAEQAPEVPAAQPPAAPLPVFNPASSPLTALETARVAGLATDLAVARAALEAEQRRLRELEKSVAESRASKEAAVLRSAEMLRKLERYQVEFRTLREAVAARDAAVSQLQVEMRTLRESHAASQQDLTGKITQLAAELAASRSALAAEQARARDAMKALAENSATHDSARSRADKALRELEHFQIELRSLRATHSALQQEHAKAVPALESRGRDNATLTADLQAARTQLESTQRVLATSQGLAESLRTQLERSEASSTAARRELDAAKAQAKSQLELLQTREWRDGSGHNMLRDLDAQVAAGRAERVALIDQRDQLRARLAVLESAPPVATGEAPAASAPRPPTPRTNPGVAAALPRFQTLGPAVAGAARRAGESVSVLVSRARRGELRSGEGRRVLGLLVAIGGVALLVWFLFHLAAAPPQVPVTLTASSPEPGSVIRDCPNCPPVTVLPPGRFKQGSARGESAAASAEKPMHWVLISRPLGMTTSAVTVDEFKQFITATNRDMQGCDIYDSDWQHSPKNDWVNPGFEQTGLHPVTCASWNDAQAYATWLSTTSGHHYRLPSASEWEYAARAGGETSQPWSGDGAEACTIANVADKSASRRYPGWSAFACDDGFVNTSPVGSFKANAFGLNDMLGNVFQWTEDCWNPDYDGAPVDGSARRDGNCAERELRGGSWFSAPAYVRANYRNHFGVDYRTSTVGIRLVREIE